MTNPCDLLSPGQRIWVAGSVNEPTALLERLAAGPLPENLTFVQFPLGGYNEQDFTRYSPTARAETFFMTRVLERAAAERVDFVPMQMRAVFDALRTRIDVALLQIAKDREGRLRIGPNVDFAAAALASARVVIAELNHAFVAPAGSPAVDPARLDLVIESERPLFELAPPEIDGPARAIGRHVADLVRDGDCIQTGIGAIPAAILAELSGKNDLGMHGGLLDDGGMALVRAGTVTGANKPVDTRRHVTGMALGSRGLIDWLADTPEVELRGADYTHEVAVIRRIPQFVSINSAVEVDLFGQVNAEFANGRQLSGTGGSVDFMRAAKASAGGRSIIAMTATARGGSVSRIVAKVELVTALRTDVDIVVTEHGVARLAGASTAERARALVAIAAPEFRDELSAHVSHRFP